MSKEEEELSFLQTQRATGKALGKVSAWKRAKLLGKHEDLVELVSFTWSVEDGRAKGPLR